VEQRFRAKCIQIPKLHRLKAFYREDRAVLYAYPTFKRLELLEYDKSIALTLSDIAINLYNEWTEPIDI
jgi:hypothetical protein